jgi:hypothetical protein
MSIYHHNWKQNIQWYVLIGVLLIYMVYCYGMQNSEAKLQIYRDDLAEVVISAAAHDHVDRQYQRNFKHAKNPEVSAVDKNLQCFDVMIGSDMLKNCNKDAKWIADRNLQFHWDNNIP